MCEFEPRGEWKSNDTQLSQLVSCRNPTKTAEKSDSHGFPDTQWYIYLRLVDFYGEWWETYAKIPYIGSMGGLEPFGRFRKMYP